MVGLNFLVFPHIVMRYLNTRSFHNNSQSVIIAAAARTPWGKYRGQLASVGALHLAQMAMEASVKQSAVPVEKIQRIFMTETPTLEKGTTAEFIFSNFINKAKYTSIIEDGKGAKRPPFIMAFDFLKAQQQAAVVLGGLTSATQNESFNFGFLKKAKAHTGASNDLLLGLMENYFSESMNRYKKSQADGVFDAELVPLTVARQQGNIRSITEITQDEIFADKDGIDNTTFHYCDGAAALVLTTMANALLLKLSPLAVVIDFQYLQHSTDIFSGSRECVEKLFSRAKLDPQQIQHWEIEDCFPQLVGFLKHHFNLNFDVINPNGGSLILGYSPAVSLTRLLTHITHSLNPLETGCVICSSCQESLALIIQKLPWPSITDRLPLVTLYTKDPCSLCDILVEELELQFSGEYQLEKIFIDKKDNLRFLRLYRFDIPVVFLNNQFLCMHRLNHRLLRKRLDFKK